MSKGLALHTLGGAILALIGVTVLIGVYSGVFDGGFNTFFCSTYTTFIYAMPGDQSAPGSCQVEEGPEYQFIDPDTQDNAILEIIPLVTDCWENNRGLLVEEKLCSGVNFGDWEDEETISKENISDKMRENNICPNMIEINSTGCVEGSEGEDNLKLGRDIEPEDTLFINYRYNATEEREYISIEPSE